MRRALIPLLLLLGCAPWNQPQNPPLQGENAPLSAEAPGDDLYIGLAFSGGGIRATAFAYGMLQELQATGTGTPNGLLDNVRLVSGVSGGSVMAAQFGLKGPQGMQGFRETFLVTGAEAYMTHLRLQPPDHRQGHRWGRQRPRHLRPHPRRNPVPRRDLRRPPPIPD